MKMPTNIVPMKASIRGEPFNDIHWEFEIKLDGFRIISYIQKGNVKLQTRSLKGYTAKFPQIVQALQKFKFDAILDGEVVMLDENGISNFNALQNWRNNEDGPLYYYVFDLLYYNGEDYKKKPLSRRKSVLKNILPKTPIVLYCDEIVTYGIPLFKMVSEIGAEGIIAKRLDSIYTPGRRSKDWLKIKTTTEDDFIITGWTRNKGTGNSISTLILGAYKTGVLQYVGEVGTGFTDRDQKEILNKLQPIKRKKCVFPQMPTFNRKWGGKKPDEIHWVKPKYVAHVKYLEKTPSGELRHQSFIRLRSDKKPEEIVIE